MERAELAALLACSVGPRIGPEPVESAGVTVIAEGDPQRFMSAFAAAVDGPGEVLLGNPGWGKHERSQLDLLLQSKIVNPKSKLGLGWLGIPTGGTSGQLKFARHDESTLAAAVVGFTQHFGLGRVNALGVLPLHHVSGLMAWLRCALTGGAYQPGEWKAIEAGQFPALTDHPDGWVISLVPTQLERLLRSHAAVAWLRKFRIIFLGGGPAPAGLLDSAAESGLPLSLGYGMTETAAMVSALRPDEFLQGARSCGQSLPHAGIGVGEDGAITVTGASLFRGYYPDWREPAAFITSDHGRFDAAGHLHVLGRRDAVMISGGEKIDPAEIEAVLRESGSGTSWVVLGVPDPEWGERVVAAHPARDAVDWVRVKAALARLSPVKRPKDFVALEEWPVNATGKINRAEVTRQVRSWRGQA